MKRTIAVGTVLLVLPFFPLPRAGAQIPASPVVVVMLENHWAPAINTSNAPFLMSLKARGTYFSNYTDVGEPSFPNYLGVASGSTQGMTSDAASAGQFSAPSIWGQLTQAGIDWRVAQEGMSTTCSTASTRTFTGSQGKDQYALKHNPSTVFRDVYPNNCSRVIDLSALTTLPPLTLVTPTICNDMHGVASATASGYPANCEKGSQALITRSDNWLATRVPAWLAGGATVIVTFDEACCQLFTVAVGPDTPVGVVNTGTFNHYSLLAGLEDRYGIPRLANAATAAALPFATLAPSPSPDPSPSPSPDPSPSPSPDPTPSPSPDPSPSPSPDPSPSPSPDPSPSPSPDPSPSPSPDPSPSPSPSPPPIFADTFDRADGNTLGSQWSYASSTWGVRSNGARFLTGAYTSTTALATVNVNTTQVSVSADIRLSSTFHRANAGLTLGALDYKNNVFCKVEVTDGNPNGLMSIGRRLNNVITSQLAAIRNAGFVNGGTYHVTCARAGDVVTMTVGARSISYTLTSADLAAFGSSTRAGFRTHVAPDEDDGMSVFDNFTVAAS
jgi:hypothetical protein